MKTCMGGLLDRFVARRTVRGREGFRAACRISGRSDDWSVELQQLGRVAFLDLLEVANEFNREASALPGDRWCRATHTRRAGLPETPGETCRVASAAGP